MLQYERIDASKGIGANKSSRSKECVIFGILKTLVLSLNHMFVMDVMIYQRWLMN